LIAGNIPVTQNKIKRETSMYDDMNREADLAVVEHHIEDLNQRIGDLQERMATMSLHKYETKNQSILLSTMQEVLMDLKLLRREMLGLADDRNAYPEVWRRSA
jgi:hypothetical protein